MLLVLASSRASLNASALLTPMAAAKGTTQLSAIRRLAASHLLLFSMGHAQPEGSSTVTSVTHHFHA
jgi:hypothetical protein